MTTIGYAGVVGSLLLIAAAGCSSPSEQTPTPFPPRPVTVAIDDLVPCSMLDDSQRKALGVRLGTPRTTTVNGLRSDICTWVGTGGIGYNAQTIPIAADAALSEAGAVPVTVNGFGAVRSVVGDLMGGGPTCQITIDAAPGQVIRVQAGSSPRPPLPSDEEMCRLATEAASMVMTTAVRTTSR